MNFKRQGFWKGKKMVVTDTENEFDLLVRLQDSLRKISRRQSMFQGQPLHVGKAEILFRIFST